MIAPMGYDAAAGALISASSGAALVQAMMGSFRRNRDHVAWDQYPRRLTQQMRSVGTGSFTFRVPSIG